MAPRSREDLDIEARQDRAGQRTVHADGGELESRVLGDVTVPAGTFKAYKVVTTNNLGEVETIWTSPNDGVVIVKRNVVRPATHPQGGRAGCRVAVQYSSRQVGISLSRPSQRMPAPQMGRWLRRGGRSRHHADSDALWKRLLMSMASDAKA